MIYGQELIEQLERDNDSLRASISNRIDRIERCETDMDDCFLSQRCESRGIQVNNDKISLLKNGGLYWFTEYATLDGKIVTAKLVQTKYDYYGPDTLRVVMPDGSIVWTKSRTEKGLAKKGLKMVDCLRPAWFRFSSSGSGLLGAYTGEYIPFPSDVNYATGEPAPNDPVEIRDHIYA